MKAALVTAFDEPPRYTEVDDPTPASEHDMVVDVIAAGLHPRVLSQADGSHYTSTKELPLVPGIDGVGRDPDGRLRYFVLPDTTLGAMAERTLVDARRSVVLPDSCDPIAVAAGMNPGMSSWVALRRRIDFRAGQKVLVLGATGNAGQLAVQIARLFGAAQIVAAGRDSGHDAGRLGALLALGATHVVALNRDDGIERGAHDEDLEGGAAGKHGAAAEHVEHSTSAPAHALGQTARDVDVVIDYLWGEPATNAMVAVVTDRADRGKQLSWIQIGSVAGPTAAIPSAALRAARMQIVGSGQGSVPTRDILAELAALADAIDTGQLQVNARPVALADIEAAWASARTATQRLVVTP